MLISIETYRTCDFLGGWGMLISIETHRTCDFLGGWGMLISIETHRTCDFLGGWGGVGSGPPNPLWIHASSVGLGMLISIGTYRSCNFSVAIFLIIEQNKLYKKIQSARTIGPLSARQRTTIRRWRFVGGPIVARDGMLFKNRKFMHFLFNIPQMDSRRHRYFPILRIFPLLRQCICL